jgi:hypothetical protein
MRRIAVIAHVELPRCRSVAVIVVTSPRLNGLPVRPLFLDNGSAWSATAPMVEAA